jgi:two-component system, OmpR family, KDP operon response regulator KdpE
MAEPTSNIVVVEDEPTIRRFIRMSLESQGHTVFEADTFKRGLIEMGTRSPNLVVLDLGLPDGDGIDLIRELRSWSNVPVVVLSARTDETQKVQALDAGADDYLAKPFGSPELLARVRAHLRRQTTAREGQHASYEFGDVRIDWAHRVVERQSQVVHLTPIEYRLLAYVVAHPEVVLTHRQLLQNVWGPSHAEDTHYVRVFMGTLRKKLEADPSRPKHFVTETGVGYRFVP